MDIDTPALPNELAFSVAAACRKWAYTSYTTDTDIPEAPRNPNVDRQYEIRLDRAISDTQTKIQSQRRALDDVPILPAAANEVTKEVTGRG